MKRPLFLSILSFTLLFSLSITAQKPITVAVHFDKKEVVMNRVTVNRESSVINIRQAVGKENRVLSAQGDPIKLFIYDSLGLTFIIDTTTGQLQRLSLHPNKGRMEYETSPAMTFAGSLFIGDKLIATNEPISSVNSRTGVMFKQLEESFPWYTATNKEFSMMITYQPWNKKLFSSIHISFVKEKEMEADTELP